LIKLYQVRSHLTDGKRGDGACVAAQPLKLVERQTDIVRHCQFYRVCVKDTGHNILPLVFGQYRVERADDAVLALMERFAIRELRA